MATTASPPGTRSTGAIAGVAAVRRREPALRYGRQYFREISGNGADLGHPLGGRCSLAFSRILDLTEIVVAMNLDGQPRGDYATVDVNLSPAGTKLVDLLEAGGSSRWSGGATGPRSGCRSGRTRWRC